MDLRRAGSGLCLVAGVFLSLMLAPSALLACCTNLTCMHCISGSTDCDGGCPAYSSCISTWTPTCNTVGCNCNNTGPTCQCGTPGPALCESVNCCSDDSAAIARERFAEVDANGDGRVSLEETGGWLLKRFGKSWLDRVDRADVAAMKREDKILQLIFDRMDTDKDKYVSPGEFDNTLAEKK